MLNTNHNNVPQLLSHSFRSTEAAIFKYIHAVFLLTLALKKRGIESCDGFDQYESDLFSLLNTVSEIEKLLLRHLHLYHLYLTTDEFAEFKNEIIHYSKDHEAKKKVNYYTSSIMKLCYGKNYTKQMDFQAENILNDLTKFFELKRSLIKL
ncbi:hypothetical protein [Hazenella coriacea]|uniref:Uncharacterized protein n=1 Tax=Hazenella coriacea TaxID=1179467 RepID=A0A4R3L2F0_9BACL|nr:hypothetical protein [Hazenella coriacea]TCS93629.1 hypothetical protein EDD58_10662 [Hazenella coriacea]